MEEDTQHGSHHAAQEHEQQVHEVQQQQQVQYQQQRAAQEQKQQEADEQLGAKVPLLTIAAMTTAMAAMSGLGALPYFFVGTMSAAWSGLANAVACGVMIVSLPTLHQPAAAASCHGRCAVSCAMHQCCHECVAALPGIAPNSATQLRLVAAFTGHQPPATAHMHIPGSQSRTSLPHHLLADHRPHPVHTRH